MNFEMIFYLAREADNTLELVEDILGRLNQFLSAACATQTPKDLALVLSEAVKRSEIILVSGGLLRNDQYNIINVISQALEIPLALKPGYASSDQPNSTTLIGAEVLSDPNGIMDGCVLTSGTQSIFILPDTPDGIEGVMNTGVLPYLASRYNMVESRPAPLARNTGYIESDSESVGTLRFYEQDAPAEKYDESHDEDAYSEDDEDDEYKGYDDELSDIPSSRTVYSSSRVMSGDIRTQRREPEVKPSLFTRHDDAAPDKPASRSRSISKPLALIFILCILAVLGYIIFSNYGLFGAFKTSEQNQEVYDNVRQLYGQASNIQLPSGTLEKFGSLYEKNSDVRGWIHIDGTAIDYPVMQSPTNDHYYEQHDFTRSASKYGTPYLDFGCDINSNSGNFIVYGANHNDGAMFADLMRYKDAEFYASHNIVQMDTLTSEMTWQIFAVCIVDSNAKGSEFNYTQTNVMEAYDFTEYIHQLRTRSIISSGIPVSMDDRLLLLVTDSDSFPGAQLLIAAVQYTDEPAALPPTNVLPTPDPIMPQKWYNINSGSNNENSESDPSEDVSADSINSGENNPALTETLNVKFNGEIVSGKTSDILAQIVEAEMGVGYSQEALKAQAVASYTYILWEIDHGTTPAVELKTAGTESKKAVQAVLGKRMTVNGKTPYTPYFLMSAGKTLSHKELWREDFPYLVSVDSSWEKNMDNYKTIVTISSSKMQARMQSAFGISLDGNPAGWIEITGHDDAAGNAGYVSSVVIGNATQSGYKFSNALGLRSHAFTVEYNPNTSSFSITTYGEGHGVGMSKLGAEGLARQGQKYTQILRHYYTGVTIE